jgi:hypothetical protein
VPLVIFFVPANAEVFSVRAGERKMKEQSPAPRVVDLPKKGVTPPRDQAPASD